MRKIFIKLIKWYQIIPGPWHKWCKYKPTCSEYAIGVINEFGVIKGGYLTFKRLLKCNYWSKGGYDPIPINNGGKNEKN